MLLRKCFLLFAWQKMVSQNIHEIFSLFFFQRRKKTKIFTEVGENIVQLHFHAHKMVLLSRINCNSCHFSSLFCFTRSPSPIFHCSWFFLPLLQYSRYSKILSDVKFNLKIVCWLLTVSVFAFSSVFESRRIVFCLPRVAHFCANSFHSEFQI